VAIIKIILYPTYIITNNKHIPTIYAKYLFKMSSINDIPQERRTSDGLRVIIPHTGIPLTLNGVTSAHTKRNKRWNWVIDKNQRDKDAKTKATRLYYIDLNDNNPEDVKNAVDSIKGVMTDLQDIGKAALEEAAVELCEKFQVKVGTVNNEKIVDCELKDDQNKLPKTLYAIKYALVGGKLNGVSISTLMKNDPYLVMKVHYIFVGTLSNDKKWKGIAIERFCDKYLVAMGPKETGGNHCLWTLMGAYITKAFKDSVRELSRSSPNMDRTLLIDKPRRGNKYTRHSAGGKIMRFGNIS